jgi:hypothetical protein
MKVIDDTGHPVAGAKVLYEEKKIGVTDSFGEWRRFMRAPLGKTITFLVQKNSEHGTYKVYKNIAIPPSPPKQGADIEISSKILLVKKIPSKKSLDTRNKSNY